MKSNDNNDQTPDSRLKFLKPPCSQEDVSQKDNNCCRVLDEVFHRNNTGAIMTLMKYSLEMSNPWVTQYHKESDENSDMQTFGDNRDMHKLWLTSSGNEMLNFLSENGKNNFPQEYG